MLAWAIWLAVRANRTKVMSNTPSVESNLSPCTGARSLNHDCMLAAMLSIVPFMSHFSSMPSAGRT